MENHDPLSFKKVITTSEPGATLRSSSSSSSMIPNRANRVHRLRVIQLRARPYSSTNSPSCMSSSPLRPTTTPQPLPLHHNLSTWEFIPRGLPCEETLSGYWNERSDQTLSPPSPSPSPSQSSPPCPCPSHPPHSIPHPPSSSYPIPTPPSSPTPTLPPTLHPLPALLSLPPIPLLQYTHVSFFLSFFQAWRGMARRGAVGREDLKW